MARTSVEVGDASSHHATRPSSRWPGHQRGACDAVGLPGFQLIQEPLDCGSRTHHPDLDLHDHANPSDLMQASAIVAALVHAAAMRPEMRPRTPLPKPLPPRRR